MTSSQPLLHHVMPHEHALASSTPPDRWPGPEAGRVRKPRRPREKWFMLALIAAALIALGLALSSRFGLDDVQDGLAALNPVVAILAMAILPLFGFSIAVVYVVAGAKFGLGLGGAVIVGITAFHLVATHWICRSFLRGPLQRYFARHQHHLPKFPPTEERSIAVMASLIPGPPYFVRNYILALTSIPLRVYFWVCLPIYVLRSYVTLSLGDLSRNLSGEKLLLLGAIYVVKLSICGYLLVRLRRRLRGNSPLG